MATATATPKTAKTTTSVDPLYTQAVAQAKAALAAQTAPIQSEQAASDAAFQQRQTDATGNAKALSDLLAKLAPNVQGNYTTAAQNDSLLANGFSAGARDAIQGNTDSLNSLLSSLGSPAQIDSHAGEVGDVLQGLGGYIPGKAIDKQGAAFGALANFLPGTALLQGQENVKSLQSQAQQADVGFQNKIAELAGHLPGDIETNYQKLQSLALADKKFALSVQNQKFSQALSIAKQKLATAKYQTDVQFKNANLKMSAARLNLQSQKFAQQTIQQNREFKLALERVGISKKGLQLRAAAQEYKLQNGGFTPSQINRFKTDALYVKSQIDGAKAKPTYDEAMSQMLKRHVPLSIANETLKDDYAGAKIELDPNLMKQYNQMTGVTLGTAPDGTAVTWSAPAGLSKTAKKTVGNILNLATEYLGTPYAWGGGGPSGPSRGTGRGANTVGFDCSSFAQFLYAKSGISIPRTTYDQFKTGLSVSKSQLQAGDLVFFRGSDSINGLPGHVGIYVGNGKMIDAPHTGSVVRVESINQSDFMGGRRYVH